MDFEIKFAFLKFILIKGNVLSIKIFKSEKIIDNILIQ